VVLGLGRRRALTGPTLWRGPAPALCCPSVL